MTPNLEGALASRLVPLPLPAPLLAGIAAGWSATVRAQAPPTLAPGLRASDRVLSCDAYDIWVVHWGPGSGIDAHDHVQSAGALHVVRGELAERHRLRSGTGLVHERLVAHRSRTFPVGHVHEVRNPGRGVATSVHVYSPPLADTTFSRAPRARSERHLHVVPERLERT